MHKSTTGVTSYCSNTLCWQLTSSTCTNENCERVMCDACGLEGTPGDPCTLSNFTEFRLQSLHLSLSSNFGSEILSGYVELTGVAHTPQVVLDTRNLSVTGVTYRQQPLRFTLVPHKLSVFGSGLVIDLPSEAVPGSLVALRVTYSTTPASEAVQWLSPAQTSGKRQPFLFTQCQAIQARSLLPCQDTPRVKVPYTADITTDSPLTALMSAIPTSSQNSDATRTFQFEQKVPIPSYLIALAIGELESREVGPRTRVWAEKSVVDVAAVEFAETESFIQAAEAICGLPYVWGRYDILVLPPSFPYGGMENPCLTFATPTLLAGDGSLVDVIAHEISHSWMGNLVTNASWEHFWLNEGWTVYVERRIVERLRGANARDCSAFLGQSGLKRAIKQLGEANRLGQMIPCLVDTDPDDAFSLVPYEKGYNLLAYLEHLVGPGNFGDFFHSYIKKFAGLCLTTADFVQFFQLHFPSEGLLVDWPRWFYTAGLPPEFVPCLSRWVIDAQELCNLWIKCDLSADDSIFAANLEVVKAAALQWRSMSAAYQRIPFLDAVASDAETRGPWSERCLQALDDLYKLSTNTNSEVKFRWQSICLSSGRRDIIPYVEAFVSSQGRMKFVRPLYRALYKLDSASAHAIFLRNQDSYHPITAKMLVKDLELDQVH